MSARAPPPKIKQEQISEPDAPSSVPIHIDGAKDDDDEFLVQTVDDVEINKPGTTEVELSGQHGGLVQKILQTKRQLEGTTEGTLESKKNSAKGPVGAKEIESLRASIQLLCQSTNPLGKTLDYLQEDADAMNKELELWKRETANFKFQAEEQAKFTMESMLPLQDQLKQLEKTIEEQVQKISSLKSDILQVHFV
jgi:TRAF3-interacting protein 1